jgi:hypothetical protein
MSKTRRRRSRGKSRRKSRRKSRSKRAGGFWGRLKKRLGFGKKDTAEPTRPPLRRPSPRRAPHGGPAWKRQTNQHRAKKRDTTEQVSPNTMRGARAQQVSPSGARSVTPPIGWYKGKKYTEAADNVTAWNEARASQPPAATPAANPFNEWEMRGGRDGSPISWYNRTTGEKRTVQPYSNWNAIGMEAGNREMRAGEAEGAFMLDEELSAAEAAAASRQAQQEVERVTALILDTAQQQRVQQRRVQHKEERKKKRRTHRGGRHTKKRRSRQKSSKA